METKPPLPPFTHETAIEKVRMAEDAWNSRDPDRVVLVYSEDTRTNKDIHQIIQNCMYRINLWRAR